MGCETREAPNADAALAALAERPYDLAFLDLRLGTANGLELLPRLLAEQPGLSVVVVTAYATVDTAVEAVKRGAEDYLPKPFTPEQIRHAVTKVAAARDTRRRVVELEAELHECVPEVDLATESPAMRSVYETIARAAPASAPVLLRGESGTGKGVLARALHAQSGRSDRPFVAVNCPTLSAELLASELFGTRRGAFTGAVRRSAGSRRGGGGRHALPRRDRRDRAGAPGEAAAFPPGEALRAPRRDAHAPRRRAHSWPPRTATSARTSRRVASARTCSIGSRGRGERAAAARPARGRAAPSRGASWRSSHAKAGRREQSLSPEAERLLAAYAWPGNVRELRNAMERCTILWPGELVEPAALPERIAGAEPTGPRLGSDVSLEDLEREHIRRVLARAPTLEEAAAHPRHRRLDAVAQAQALTSSEATRSPQHDHAS